MSKEDAIKKIKEILAKDVHFKDASVTVIFKPKKRQAKAKDIK
jgi:hypothetical protein